MTARIFMICVRCSSPLATLCWCENTDDHKLHMLWRCPACASDFETVETSEEAASKVKKAVEVFWPTLLVA